MFCAAVVLFLAADLSADPPGRIAFMRAGKVWVIRGADGTGEQALTDTLRFSANRPLTWSPDGRRLLFWSHNPVGWDIWSMAADGRDQRNLTNVRTGGCRSAVFSPDGRRIAFLRDDPEGLYVMGADGSNPRRLSERAFRDSTPSWRPDGRQIAYTLEEDGGHSIYVFDLDSRADRRIARGAWDPLWSPDGRRLLFVTRRSGGASLVTVAPDGTGEAVLTEGPDAASEAVWSPDGTRVAYFATRGGQVELRVVETGRRVVRRLAAGEDRGWQVTWSPDGQWLAYSVGPAGKQVISITDAAGRGVRQLAGGGACYPVWQPGPG